MTQNGPTGLEAYRAVAEELDVEPEARASVLADLEPAIVEMARRYAERAHKRWPPRPVMSGWRVSVLPTGDEDWSNPEC